MPTTRKQGKHDWMSVGAAGRVLGRTRLAVLQMIVRGDLIGEDRAGYTFVRSDTVDALLAARKGTADEAA